MAKVALCHLQSGVIIVTVQITPGFRFSVLDRVLSPIAKLDHFIKEIVIVSVLKVTRYRQENRLLSVFHSCHPNGVLWDQDEHRRRHLWWLPAAVLGPRL